MTEPDNLTRSEVFSACDALARAGASVTNTAVHKWLGRGSMSTIDKHTKAWQSENPNPIDPQATDPGVGLPDSIVDAAQVMFKIALDEARRQVKKEFDQRHTEFEAERERLGTELLDAFDRVAEAEKNVAGLLEARKKYKDLLEEEQTANRSLEEKLGKTERDLAALAHRCAEQEKALSQQSEQEAVQRSSTETLETEQARFEAIEKQLRERLEEALAHGRELQGMMDKVANDVLASKERLKSKSEQLLESDLALAEVRSQVAGMELTVVELTRNLEQMTDRCNEQTATVEQLNQQCTALTGTLEAREVEMQRLRSERDQEALRANQALADLSEIVRAGLRQKGGV